MCEETDGGIEKATDTTVTVMVTVMHGTPFRGLKRLERHGRVHRDRDFVVRGLWRFFR